MKFVVKEFNLTMLQILRHEKLLFAKFDLDFSEAVPVIVIDILC